MDERKAGLKLALIGLLLSVAGLAAVYQSVYPLSLSAGTGYLLQIPPVFWVFVVVSLASLFFVATLARSSLVTLGSIVGVALVLNFHYFLIYAVNGRDMRGEVSRLFFTLGRSHLGIDLYSYFQWPAHFILTQQIDRIVSLSLTETIWAGYLTYYVLFAVGVGVFAYSFTDGDTFSWVAAAVFYLVFTRQWLNNQFVPQFLGVVLLLFLFAIHDVEDTRLRVLRAVLYLVLVLAHPFFFVFYVMYVVALPFVRAAVDTVEQVGTPDRPLYYQSLEVVRYAPRTVLALGANLRRRVDISWVNYVVFLVVGYLSFLLVRFSLFKERLFVLLAGPMSESSSGKIPARVMELLFGSSRGGSGSAVDVVLLNELTSPFVRQITLYGTIGVLLGLLLLATISLLSKPASRVSPGSIAVALSGAAYYVVGFVLPIIGDRAFQVLLLPLGTFLDGDHEGSRYLKLVVLLLLVASPVVAANFLANYSLAGGGNAHDYHADEAGRFMVEYTPLEREGAVSYPAAGFPPYLSKSGERLPVVTVESMIVDGFDGSENVVYGTRQEYRAVHFDHRCNFSPERRNVVYDNQIQVLRDSIVSEPFACAER